jgi:hypothetical protein
VNIGEVLTEGWALYKRLFGRSVVVAGLIFLVVSLADALASTAATFATGVVSLVLALVGGLLVQGALVEVVRDIHEGRAPAAATAYYERTRSRLGTLLGTAVLYGVGVAVGFVLLIVPGLIAVARWSLIVPLVMIERLGWRAAFRRSNELVKGRTGSVLGLIVITNVLTAVATLVLRAAFSGLPLFWSGWIGGTVAGALVVPFEAYVLTVLYYRLRATGS